MAIYWLHASEMDSVLRMAHVAVDTDADDDVLPSWEDEVHSGILVFLMPEDPDQSNVIDADDIATEAFDDWADNEPVTEIISYPGWWRLWRRFVAAITV